MNYVELSGTNAVCRSLLIKTLEPVCKKYELTRLELDVLLFLQGTGNKGDTAADLVETRKLSKSHVSLAVSKLYEKGLIDKRYEDGNHKSIHLFLTYRAAPIIADGLEAEQTYMRLLFEGFSKEEQKTIQSFMERVNRNAVLALEKI